MHMAKHILLLVLGAAMAVVCKSADCELTFQPQASSANYQGITVRC
jgi:hypothetical protein